LIAGAPAVNWANNPVAVTQNNGHSFAKAIEHVFAPHGENKFIAYNNDPPDVPKVRTKSNSKGVLMMDITGTDAAAWIVHTVPGFPKARTGYLFPPAEVQKGHLLICLTIKEDQIDTIAMTLRIATPLIYYNDIPDAQMDSRPNLKKLANGESRLTPPLTVTQDTTTAGAPSLKVTIYSKGEKSRYEIYRRVLVKKLKTGIKVWTTRDKTLKSDCRILDRSIKLVTSPITIDDHASSLESDVSQWLISEPGNKFCVIDKPYHKESACFALLSNGKFYATKFSCYSSTVNAEHVFATDASNKFTAYNNEPPGYSTIVLIIDSRNQEAASRIVHTVSGFPKTLKGYLFPPAEIQKGHLFICLTINESKIDAIGAAANWAGSPGAVTADNGHSFAKALEHVIAVNANNKFISYNNHPPDVPKVKTKSNSKGVLMMDITGPDAAAWIVHTVPGFPKARTGYLFPPAEVQKGHLLICLTIKEDQIDTIALTLRFATPLIYYNDIPDTEMNSRPNLKKLVSGESRVLPPLAVTKDTTTAAAVGLKVTIYSKGEKSRYGKSVLL
ncbi:Plancitoxin-1, partial [Trichinella britovi]